MQLLALDLGKVGNALDGVFVHGIVVIHIELHHGHDRLEFGDKYGQHTQLVHPPQGAFGVAVFQQQIKENAGCFLVGAHFVIDQVQMRRHQPHCIGVDQNAGAQGFFEQAQDVHFVLQEQFFIRNIQAVLNDFISRFGFLSATKEPQQAGFLFGVAGLECGQQDAGQIAHMGGVAEIILHEIFHLAAAVVGFVTHAFGYFDLQIEC